MLTNEYVAKCFEMSSITKYWIPILEAYFGGKKESLFVQGDTMSIDCKSLHLNYKPDLRIVASAEGGSIEVATGEFRKYKEDNPWKAIRLQAQVRIGIQGPLEFSAGKIDILATKPSQECPCPHLESD
ncbi:hypothetical protein CLU79DRAFT_857631, partial [Phycomyces nitens]